MKNIFSLLNYGHLTLPVHRTMGGAGLLIFLTCNVWGKEFYVAPAGDDGNPGTRELPFATISGAREKVREWNASNTSENITVWLSGGEYRLHETVVFGLQDGARPGQTITWSAIKGEKPVISSDVSISGWKQLKKMPVGLPNFASGKVWVALVPDLIRDFKVLYNSKGPLPRARTKAYANMRQIEGWFGPPDYHNSIPFLKEDAANIFSPGNTEILVIPVAPWTMNILPVKNAVKGSGMVYLGANSTYALAKPRFYTPLESVWVENSFAGLDEPGKWVFDAESRLLYYWPINGDSPGNDIVVPSLIEMFRIEGQIDYNGPIDVPVRGLNFKGLTFTRGDRFESAGLTGRGLQHDWERFDESTALVRFRGAEDCSVENCVFTHSGGTGIRLDLYARKIRIVNNELSELGGVGILLAGYGPGTKDVNNCNEISNNYIHHIGRIWWHSIGIWAWQSGHNIIRHNTIHDLPYTAIAITGRINWDRAGISECSQTVRWDEVLPFNGTESWEERERFLHARHNIIENNDIHHVVNVMFDGNGVYISGAGKGNIVRGNYIHNTPSMHHGEGIRCDDDQHETMIENNVVFRFGTLGTGICSKGRNHIFNNIVACPPYRVRRGMLSFEPPVIKSNAGSRVFNNIFYATLPDQPFVYQKGIEKIIHTIEIDRNIYFNSSDPNAADKYLEWAKQNGNETNSLQTDPLFMDVKNGNFQLKPDSPAFSLGFKAFTLNTGCSFK